MPVLPHQTWIPTEIMHTPQNMYIHQGNSHEEELLRCRFQTSQNITADLINDCLYFIILRITFANSTSNEGPFAFDQILSLH